MKRQSVTSAKTAAKLCPRWDSCSVNNCLLDPHMAHPLDEEQRCPMEKAVRVRIASQFPGMIPRDGLSAREWAGRAVYARLPSLTKLAGLERLKVARAKLAAHKATNARLSAPTTPASAFLSVGGIKQADAIERSVAP